MIAVRILEFVFFLTLLTRRRRNIYSLILLCFLRVFLAHNAFFDGRRIYFFLYNFLGMYLCLNLLKKSLVCDKALQKRIFSFYFFLSCIDSPLLNLKGCLWLPQTMVDFRFSSLFFDECARTFVWVHLNLSENLKVFISSKC